MVQGLKEQIFPKTVFRISLFELQEIAAQLECSIEKYNDQYYILYYEENWTSRIKMLDEFSLFVALYEKVKSN